ncbi:MAG TPA: hypothetical protein VF043_33780 [Ktedonobacteraceae bacterium]
MDPLTLILTALTAGAAVGEQAVVSDAIKDAYNGLKALIQRKFAGKPSAEAALTEHETDPQIWVAPLKKFLAQEHIDQDQAILQAAEQLLTQIKAQPGGEQHIQSAVGSYIAQADRGSTASVTITPPKEP